MCHRQLVCLAIAALSFPAAVRAQIGSYTFSGATGLAAAEVSPGNSGRTCQNQQQRDVIPKIVSGGRVSAKATFLDIEEAT